MDMKGSLNLTTLILFCSSLLFCFLFGCVFVTVFPIIENFYSIFSWHIAVLFFFFDVFSDYLMAYNTHSVYNIHPEFVTVYIEEILYFFLYGINNLIVIIVYFYFVLSKDFSYFCLTFGFDICNKLTERCYC
jgi:hypothetical protein